MSGSTVTFRTQPLSNIAKTCTDMVIGTGAITDFEGLYNEETLSGQVISDAQIPTPITITAPTNNKFVGGSGTFTLTYAFPENMTAGSIVLRLTDNTGSIINYSIPTFASSGSHSLINHRFDYYWFCRFQNLFSETSRKRCRRKCRFELARDRNGVRYYQSEHRNTYFSSCSYIPQCSNSASDLGGCDR